MFKHTIIQQEMPKIKVSIKPSKCFLIVQFETLLNSLDNLNYERGQNYRTLPKSAEINFDIWIQLNSLEHVLCIMVYSTFVCLQCEVNFASHHFVTLTFAKGMVAVVFLGRRFNSQDCNKQTFNPELLDKYFNHWMLIW